MACPDCQSPIQGHYHCPGVIGFFDYDAPHYCQNCGKAFPWTTRALEAARQLATDDDTLSADESERFAKDLEEITRETPQAKASAGRIKKMLGKMTAGTGAAIRDILIDIASESVRKMIWP
ncbi:hypothetical protein DSM3645_27937 [Blastopirellula marina DSM 3645]|uniref:Uncharacterized protein n=2 Tax=Blastopirellula marina TaxID=124 RepID=A3ZP13_9BACT|nr:hypothetical protein DSM3645_27937 [Blastopirellula marina DSM 3645]